MEVVDEYHPNSQLARRAYKLNGVSHREDGPAFECWYDNGQPHYCVYNLNGRTQRKGGPCFQAWNCSGRLIEEYYRDDGYHRIDGPAFWREINGAIHEEWWVNNQLHRVDGPAYSWGREVQWWLRGKCYGYGDTPSKEFCDKILPPTVRQVLQTLPLPIYEAIAEQFCAI